MILPKKEVLLSPTFCNVGHKFKGISYKKMKVCVCVNVCVCVCMYVCVCVCVQRPAAGPTQAITPKFGVDSSFHPGSAPSQGRQKILAFGGTPYSDPVWNSLKGKELGGGQQTKVAPWGGFAMLNFICGGLIQTWSPQGPPYQMGVYAVRIGRGLPNKSCSSFDLLISTETFKFWLWQWLSRPKSVISAQ